MFPIGDLWVNQACLVGVRLVQTYAVVDAGALDRMRDSLSSTT